MKTFIRALLITLLLLGTAVAGTQLPIDGGGKKIQVMIPSKIVAVAIGNITVSTYSVVMFDQDETIYLNGDSGTTYDLPANTPLGINPPVTTIHISANGGMLVMDK